MMKKRRPGNFGFFVVIFWMDGAVLSVPAINGEPTTADLLYKALGGQKKRPAINDEPTKSILFGKSLLRFLLVFFEYFLRTHLLRYAKGNPVRNNESEQKQQHPKCHSTD
jgi:hypothetical protein